MAIYGYARVSTQTQADDGESLDVQKRKIKGRAIQEGWNVDKVFVERGISGGKPLSARPKGAELLHNVSRGDIIIATKLDRMFRSASDALSVLADLKKQKVSLHLIDLGGDVCGTGVAQMIFTILSAVAQFERERIAERIAEVKFDQRDRNRYLGGRVPFGFSVAPDGSLLEDEQQQNAILEITHLRREGKSYRYISDRMNQLGHNLSHMGVKKVVARQPAA